MAGRESKSLLEKNVILTECASKVFHSHGQIWAPARLWVPICGVSVCWLKLGCCGQHASERQPVGQTDGQMDTRGGLEQEVAQKPRRQPSACLGLFPRLQGAVKGRGVAAGAVWLWGSPEAGPVFAPHIHPGAGAHGRLPPRTGRWPCQLSAPATRSAL